MKILLFRLQQKSGQAIMEMIFALPLVATCLIVSLLFFQVKVQRLWLDYQLYQAVVCMARGEGTVRCKDKLYQQSKYFLWIGKLTDIHLYKWGRNQWRGVMTWKGLYWSLHLTKSLNLDLLSRSL